MLISVSCFNSVLQGPFLSGAGSLSVTLKQLLGPGCSPLFSAHRPLVFLPSIQCFLLPSASSCFSLVLPLLSIPSHFQGVKSWAPLDVTWASQRHFGVERAVTEPSPRDHTSRPASRGPHGLPDLRGHSPLWVSSHLEREVKRDATQRPLLLSPFHLLADFHGILAGLCSTFS